MLRKNQNGDLKDMETIKKAFESRLGIPDGSHPKYFLWWKWDNYKNWDEKTFGAIENGEFSRHITSQIQEILKRLEGVEL